jgi:hypothetical protein
LDFRFVLDAHALAIAKEMSSKPYDLLSCVQAPADDCLFFTQLMYLHRLK